MEESGPFVEGWAGESALRWWAFSGVWERREGACTLFVCVKEMQLTSCDRSTTLGLFFLLKKKAGVCRFGGETLCPSTIVEVQVPEKCRIFYIGWNWDGNRHSKRQLQVFNTYR